MGYLGLWVTHEMFGQCYVAYIHVHGHSSAKKNEPSNFITKTINQNGHENFIIYILNWFR